MFRFYRLRVVIDIKGGDGAAARVGPHRLAGQGAAGPAHGPKTEKAAARREMQAKLRRGVLRGSLADNAGCIPPVSVPYPAHESIQPPECDADRAAACLSPRVGGLTASASQSVSCCAG